MSESTQKPDCMTDEHLEYLDDLRESGLINMFGAGSCLIKDFGLNKKDAIDILGYWMETFPR